MCKEYLLKFTCGILYVTFIVASYTNKNIKLKFHAVSSSFHLIAFTAPIQFTIFIPDIIKYLELSFDKSASPAS